MKKGLILKIHGRVQGVFFRAQTVERAKKLELTGFVKNEENGSVKIIAEGEEKNLFELKEWVKKGPSLARIEKIEEIWQDFQGKFEDFEINFV